MVRTKVTNGPWFKPGTRADCPRSDSWESSLPYFRSAFILKGSPFANVFWLAFWEHLCPVVSCACWLPVELNLESQLFLETNPVLTHTPLGKPIRTADPLFPDGKLLRCKVADPKGTGKTPKGPTQIPVRIFTSGNAISSLILSAQLVVAERFWFQNLSPWFWNQKLQRH